MGSKKYDKARELAKETLGVEHKVLHEGVAPRVKPQDMPTREDFKKGREICDRLEAQDADRKKPKSKAKPKMTRKSFRDLLHRKIT